MHKESDMRPYQKMMIDHVIDVKKGALYAGMGLGKTVAVLTAIDRMKFAELLDKPVLVLAPLRVAKDVWPNEPAEWEHLKHMRVVPIVGKEYQRRAAFHVPADVYTINYENFSWLVKTWGEHWPYGMLVIDESTKLKSLRATIRSNKDGTEWVQGQGGIRAKALLKVVYHFKTERIVELSGTPAPNGLKDLWGQIFFLDFGQRLGRVYDAFITRWFRPKFDGFGHDPLPHAEKEIKNRIKDVC